MKGWRPGPCPPPGKWERKILAEPGCGSPSSPGAAGPRTGRGEQRSHLLRGVRQRSELGVGAGPSMDPEERRLRGKMRRPEGTRVDRQRVHAKGGGGRARRAEEEREERSFPQLRAPGLHINEQGCPLWAKRGKSLLSMEQYPERLRVFATLSLDPRQLCLRVNPGECLSGIRGLGLPLLCALSII